MDVRSARQPPLTPTKGENMKKNRYILGEGYPWVTENNYFVFLNIEHLGSKEVKLNYPKELLDSAHNVKYRLVLERLPVLRASDLGAGVRLVGIVYDMRPRA